MELSTIAAVLVGAAGLGVVVWVLAKIGRALVTVGEALAAAAAVFVVLWLVVRAVWWALRQAFTHWRMSLSVVALLAWGQWWGWSSLMITAGVVTGMLAGWRLYSVRSFDVWAGRWLRSWWLRWTVYAPKLPGWLDACGLGVQQDAAPVVFALTPLGRALGRARRPVRAQLPRVLGVHSGVSWDEVRVRLVPAPTPHARPTAMSSRANKSPSLWPNSTQNSVHWGCADASPLWMPHPNR